MTAQYKRKASLTVITGNQLIDLTDMHFTFDIRAWTMNTPKTAYIRIYNLSKTTSRLITKEGDLIMVSAGYEGNFNQIFKGEIVQVRNGRENSTDTYLDITAAVSDQLYNYAMLNFSMAAGSDAVGRLGQISKHLGLNTGTIHAPENGPKLSRGVVFFGMARDHLTVQAAAIGANWNITDDGELDVVNVGGYKPGDIPVITSDTGLIGFPEQTEIGISGKCLLNPNLQQNMLVKLDNSQIRQYGYSTNTKNVADQTQSTPPLSADGTYKLLYVNHIGDTRGQDWYSEFVCYSRFSYDPGALEQQLSYNPSTN